MGPKKKRKSPGKKLTGFALAANPSEAARAAINVRIARQRLQAQYAAAASRPQLERAGAAYGSALAATVEARGSGDGDSRGGLNGSSDRGDRIGGDGGANSVPTTATLADATAAAQLLGDPKAAGSGPGGATVAVGRPQAASVAAAGRGEEECGGRPKRQRRAPTELQDFE